MSSVSLMNASHFSVQDKKITLKPCGLLQRCKELNRCTGHKILKYKAVCISDNSLGGNQDRINTIVSLFQLLLYCYLICTTLNHNLWHQSSSKSHCIKTLAALKLSFLQRAFENQCFVLSTGIVCISQWRQLTRVLTLGSVWRLPVARLEGTEVEGHSVLAKCVFFFHQSYTTGHDFRGPMLLRCLDLKSWFDFGYSGL